MTKKLGWLCTSSGIMWQADHPDPAKIHIEDMALALSRIVRFGGHYKKEIVHYSVAEHLILCCEILMELRPDSPIDLQLACLLHDGHEAYSGFTDVCGNMKPWALMIGMVETGIDNAIAAKFHFDPALFKHPNVKQVDAIALDVERKIIMPESECPWANTGTTFKPRLPLGKSQGYVLGTFLGLFEYIQSLRQ